MTEAEELAWHRDWRKRIISAHRLWWKPSTYQAACDRWSDIKGILKEQPPSQKGSEE